MFIGGPSLFLGRLGCVLGFNFWATILGADWVHLGYSLVQTLGSESVIVNDFMMIDCVILM